MNCKSRQWFKAIKDSFTNIIATFGGSLLGAPNRLFYLKRPGDFYDGGKGSVRKPAA